MTLPVHLVAEVAALDRGEMDGDVDRRMRLYADLLVAGAVPPEHAAAVSRAVSDGWLSASGDVLRYASEDRGQTGGQVISP